MVTLVENVVQVQELERELVVADRCDRCGAQAFMQAIKDDLDLLFCAHHGREYTPALVDQNFVVLDSSHRLNAKPYEDME